MLVVFGDVDDDGCKYVNVRGSKEGFVAKCSVPAHADTHADTRFQIDGVTRSVAWGSTISTAATHLQWKSRLSGVAQALCQRASSVSTTRNFLRPPHVLSFLWLSPINRRRWALMSALHLRWIGGIGV